MLQKNIVEEKRQAINRFSLLIYPPLPFFLETKGKNCWSGSSLLPGFLIKLSIKALSPVPGF
jgi:hypothetical protein